MGWARSTKFSCGLTTSEHCNPYDFRPEIRAETAKDTQTLSDSLWEAAGLSCRNIKITVTFRSPWRREDI